MINRLEKAGFVRRAKDPNDLRIVYVEPIPENLQPLGDIFGPLGEAMSELFSRYSADELRLILDYTRTFHPGACPAGGAVERLER